MYVTDTYNAYTCDFNVEDCLMFPLAFFIPFFFFSLTYFIFFSSIALYRLIIILHWYSVLVQCGEGMRSECPLVTDLLFRFLVYRKW